LAKPRKTAMVTELLRRTSEYFEDAQHTPADYVQAWIEEGRSLVALAVSLTESIHNLEPGQLPNKPGQFSVTRNMIDRYIREIVGDEQAVAIYSASRKVGAHGMVEHGVQKLDEDKGFDRDQTNARVRQLEARERLAAVWNREYAKSQNQTNVSISFASMHLDALRQRRLTATATISPTAEGAQPVDTEVESDGE